MIINVKVKPGSLHDNVKRLEDGSYLIFTRENAVGGKANVSVIKLLSKEFGVSYKNIHIKNPTSRKKIVDITILP